MESRRGALCALAGALALAGCADMPKSWEDVRMRMTPGPRAEATLEPTKGNDVRGTVAFAERGGRVLVVASVTGLTPGPHGFHIHEKGDCSSGDGMSAGGHFNPLGKPHAHYALANRHAGDLPMLVADTRGNADLRIEMDIIGIGSGAADIVGRAVIVHKDPDDFQTQPTGNSGARVACGVIRRTP